MTEVEQREIELVLGVAVASSGGRAGEAVMEEKEEHSRGMSPAAVGRGCRIARSSGPEVTDRDIEVLRWIGRHGMVKPEQIARRFFPSAERAYRRLDKLQQLNLIRRDRTFWREPHVVRVTKAGARLADLDVGPAQLVHAELRHAWSVVDLTEALLEANHGAVLTTERQLRVTRWRDQGAAARGMGAGRCPTPS